MDRESLENILDPITLRMTMNDGRSFTVESGHGIMLSDLDAYIQNRSESDGKLRGIHLPFVTMTGVDVNVSS